MNKLQKIHWHKSFGIMFVLILLMISGFIVAATQINRMEEERGFTTLYEEAGRVADDFEARIQSDREQLELIASVVATYDDLTSPRLWDVLDGYTSVGLISRMDLLLPDDSVVTSGGETVQTTLSFSEQAALGAHVTNREEDFTDGGRYILRHYVPVIRRGETIAMLCGVIDLKDIPGEIRVKPYSGEAAIYIIEGESGDFIVDTWHEEMGNIWDLGEREMAPGYDHEQLKQGLIHGQSDYVVFVSRTIGEYLYFYYEPMDINDWRIALSVPESTVFANASAIRQVIRAFLIFEVVLFVLYFIWMIFYVLHETGEKQRQLDTISHIYDVENLLFNAHENQENISAALKKIANMVRAELAGYWVGSQDKKTAVFSCSSGVSSLTDENMYYLLEYFRHTDDSFEMDNLEEIQSFLRNKENIRNIIAVPVKNVGGAVAGILYVYNCKRHSGNLELIKSISFSFTMLAKNMRSYNAIKELGEKDILLGLNNRNRYEMDIDRFEHMYEMSLACIYIDVNGLHELNNAKGHEAGDRMLQSVAGQIREKFGVCFTYRIGGDEFVIFVVDTDEAEIKEKLANLTAELVSEDIHVSIGLAWENEDIQVESMIKTAEARMYADKKRYYEEMGYDRRRGK